MAKEDWKQLTNGSWAHNSGTIIKPTKIKMGEQFLWEILWADGTVERVLHLGSKQAVRVVEEGIPSFPYPNKRKK